MRVCIVQSLALPGDVSANIENHLRLVQMAIEEGVDLIMFPELSITGYEPTLARELACDASDHRFDSFQRLADEHDVNIGIGMPTLTEGGVHITMIVFCPMEQRWVYSKQELHEDELPYFVPGSNRSVLLVKGWKVAMGICYETLQRAHFEAAAAQEADLFIASVSKPDRKIDDARKYFSAVSKEFDLPVLMSNSIGFYDDFLSNGKSGAWNRKGETLAQLDETRQGLLIYDASAENVAFVKQVIN